MQHHTAFYCAAVHYNVLYYVALYCTRQQYITICYTTPQYSPVPKTQKPKRTKKTKKVGFLVFFWFLDQKTKKPAPQVVGFGFFFGFFLVFGFETKSWFFFGFFLVFFWFLGFVVFWFFFGFEITFFEKNL